LTGSDWVIDSREATTSRFAPSTLPPELNATRTESSIPNSRNAATTDNSVSRVRVLLRNSWAQISERYFISVSSGSLPCEGRGGLGRGCVGAGGFLRRDRRRLRHPLPASPCLRRGRSKDQCAIAAASTNSPLSRC